MGVITTADEKITLIKEHLKAALKEADKFLSEDTWGHDEYKSDYIKKVNEIRYSIYNALLDLK